MDVHPTKNGINRYWSIPIYRIMPLTSGLLVTKIPETVIVFPSYERLAGQLSNQILATCFFHNPQHNKPTLISGASCPLIHNQQSGTHVFPVNEAHKFHIVITNPHFPIEFPWYSLEIPCSSIELASTENYRSSTTASPPPESPILIQWAPEVPRHWEVHWW